MQYDSTQHDSTQYDGFRRCDIKYLLKRRASHAMLSSILKDNPKPKPAAGRPNIRRAREEMAPLINQNTLDAKEPPADQNEDSIEKDIAYERRVNTMCGGCFRLICPAPKAADGKRPERECLGRKAQVGAIVTSDDWAWLGFCVVDCEVACVVE